MIWGVDLGVRSFHASGLSYSLPNERELPLLVACAVSAPRSVRTQGPFERSSELKTMADSLRSVVGAGDQVFVEEPPLAGSRNLRVFARLSQSAGVLATAAMDAGASAALVPVDTWKRAVVGKGGVSKEEVARYLATNFAEYYAECDGDQNAMDATCLALYGHRCTRRAVI